MDDIIKYEVYHVTDTENLEKIINGSFEYHKNDIHWLGQGVYFFLDISLAKDWATKNVGGYGKIISPAYIKCVVNVDKKYLLDLRYLEDYNFVKQCFDKFYKTTLGIYYFKRTNYKFYS